VNKNKFVKIPKLFQKKLLTKLNKSCIIIQVADEEQAGSQRAARSSKKLLDKESSK
jgi:hypothetical protein